MRHPGYDTRRVLASSMRCRNRDIFQIKGICCLSYTCFFPLLGLREVVLIIPFYLLHHMYSCAALTGRGYEVSLFVSVYVVCVG